jgi:putative acetyltransferase
VAAVTIAREDPRQADVAGLVRNLDRYMAALYPTESNHLLDIETLAGEDVVFLVARLDGAVAGRAALLRHGAGFGEIKRLWVESDRRGSGIARRLLAELEALARDLGLDLLCLETGTRQPKALALFEALAFQRCGPFGNYPADDPLSIFMEKQLTGSSRNDRPGDRNSAIVS